MFAIFRSRENGVNVNHLRDRTITAGQVGDGRSQPGRPATAG
jgi:hypothetical protein